MRVLALESRSGVDLFPNAQAAEVPTEISGTFGPSSCITDVVYWVQDEAVPRPATREGPMKRRTLDIIFSVGGLVLALLLLILGLVLQNQANFAEDYVHDQLAAERITFTPVDSLSDEEKKSSCLVKYASDQLTTGKQAECYANGYIALHLSEVNDGKTYAETSGESCALLQQRPKRLPSPSLHQRRPLPSRVNPRS